MPRQREPETSSSAPGARAFHPTRWSLVARAQRHAGGERDAREALERLCASYWYPLYAYARRRGLAHHAAQDLVQSFFARLFEKEELALADPARGRFRSFLLAALSSFLANERDAARALKRGGDRARVSIDDAEAERRWSAELAVDAAPERAFERQWAREVLARALAALEAEWTRAGRAELHARLRPLLLEGADASGAALPDGASRAAIARDLSMTENAVRIALHRLRKRYGELVRLEVADTVSDPADVEAELGALFEALRDRAT